MGSEVDIELDQTRQTTIVRNPYGDLNRCNVGMNICGAAKKQTKSSQMRNIRRSISMGRKDDQKLMSGASTFMSKPDQSTTVDHIL